MKSEITRGFRKRYSLLPPEIQAQARQAYSLWLRDPWHNSLRFKRVHRVYPVYSARVGSDWRVLGTLDDNVVLWLWIGAHAEYDGILRQL